MSKTNIYLVPGLFGFVQLGAVNYFHRVGDVLDRALKKEGCKQRLCRAERGHRVLFETNPTALLRKYPRATG